MIHTGDCLAVMRSMEPGSIDSIVTDPPYGLRFMGKEWDHGVPGPHFWEAALHVAKPGAYLLAFGGTRTHHRLTCAIEDAGWEIRDCLMWLYGQGFPKSHDVSKAIDKTHGCIDKRVVTHYKKQGPRSMFDGGKPRPVSLPASLWQGWGTALKPAWEPVIMARKPLDGTVAENVQRHGTGGLNVDGCRLTTNDNLNGGGYSGGQPTGSFGLHHKQPHEFKQPSGRWPANVCLDEEAAAMLDEQSGTSSGQERVGFPGGNTFGGGKRNAKLGRWYGDSGGASRFFYVAKASRKDRGEGNRHPTVKPTALMRWLCRLVTPPNGVILGPFTGSGSTGVAAVQEGFRFVGIELEPEYVKIAEARIAHAAGLFATTP